MADRLINLSDPTEGISFQTVANLTLSQSSFNGGLGTYFETSANAAMTLNADLRDGVERVIMVKNTHATNTILVTAPVPVITDSAGIIAIPATNLYVLISFFWSATLGAWVLNWGGAMELKTV
jgi:hypothetical protein